MSILGESSSGQERATERFGGIHVPYEMRSDKRSYQYQEFPTHILVYNCRITIDSGDEAGATMLQSIDNWYA